MAAVIFTTSQYPCPSHKSYPLSIHWKQAQLSGVIHAGGTHMRTHRAPRFLDHTIDGIPLSVLKSNALGHLPQRLVHSMYVWLARGETRVQPPRKLWVRSLAHCLYGQTVHPWLKRPTRYHMLHLEPWPCDRGCIAWFPSVSMPFGYTLNFDLYLATHVTDDASRGFLVLACRLATPWTLTLWPRLHRVVS